MTYLMGCVVHKEKSAKANIALVFRTVFVNSKNNKN